MRRTIALATLIAAAVMTVPPPAAQAASRLDAPALERLRDTLAAAGPIGTAAYVDAESGTVVLRVPGGPTTALRSAVGTHSNQVRLEEGARAAIPMADVVGGMPMETAYGERSCTTGFLASGGGWLWMVTAGHCVADGSGPSAVWYTPRTASQRGDIWYNLIGTGTILAAVPGRDFGVIQISQKSPHTFRPAVLFNGVTVNVTRAAMPTISVRGLGGGGTNVCKNGATTGFSCGHVTNINVSVNFTTGLVTGLIETTVCAQLGDSGAPLVSANDVAVFTGGGFKFYRDGYGVLAGGSAVPCSDPTFRSYYSPLVDALANYGLTLVVAS